MDWKGSKWIGKGEKEGAREMQVGKRESRWQWRLTVIDGDILQVFTEMNV